MSWLGEKFSQYRKYSVATSIAGIITYPITLYNFLNQTDDAIRNRFNDVCGTSYSRGDKWTSLRKTSINHFSPKMGFFSRLKHGMKLSALNTKKTLRTLGPKPYLWYAAQEISYFAAIVPLQVEAGVFIDSEGGDLASSVGLNVLTGIGLSWFGRRIPMFLYVDRNTKLFVNPTPDMCRYAKEFETAPKTVPSPRSERSLFAQADGESLKVGLETAVKGAGFAATAWAIARSVVSAATAMFFIVPPGFEDKMLKESDRKQPI